MDEAIKQIGDANKIPSIRTSDLCRREARMFGIGPWEVMMILVVAIGGVFWLWMLVECAVKEPNNVEKIVWVVIIAVTSWLGAAIYFLVRRPKRIRESSDLAQTRERLD